MCVAVRFLLSVLLFFFFQAEDGIRDVAVTGVQTCALPISVLEIEQAGLTHRIATLAARGTPVLAYGSHVRADLLRAAREAGATAVPNSQVEERLRELLGTL